MKKTWLNWTVGILFLMGATDLFGAEDFEIPYQKFILNNGLTLIVHEDHKTPIVAVNIWYHVGSKNEKPGITGFAHLFEHLMFNGSEHFNDDWFKITEPLGATTLNGTTWFDRTNYFQNVPKSALDTILWLESDRMGHLLGVIDQERLDEQRGVVQNEKLQGENQPYGKVDGIILENVYPQGHPYSWDSIGSMDDLNAASLEDVKSWFNTYYGAANAVICVAGDVDPQVAKGKVEQYFGDIDPGPPVMKQELWIARRSGSHRVKMADRVPHSKLFFVWNIPQWGSRAGNHLDLLASILSQGKTSRLYKRLVYEDQIALDVDVFAALFEIGGRFRIEAEVKSGVDPALVEKVIREELQQLLREGPTQAEVDRAQTEYVAAFIRAAEQIGGFGGKSEVLARGMVYGGSPDHYRINLKHVRMATPESLLETARQWLGDGLFLLRVDPVPEFKTSGTDVDRSKIPEAGRPPVAVFPKTEEFQLKNGLKVILAERTSVPLVEMRLLVDAGFAADHSSKAGLTSLAMGMLDEGTTTRDALRISEELQSLGAELRTSSNLDLSTVGLSALKQNLDPSLALYADVILNPSFPQADFNRLKNQRLAIISQEKSQPFQMVLRIFPKLLYGDKHAYGNPLSGSGHESSVSTMTIADMKTFHKTWFRPNNSTLVVVGDIGITQLKPKLEQYFGAWKAAEVPRKNIDAVADLDETVVYLLDRPDSTQSVIMAAQLAPPKANEHEHAFSMMNDILGGQFTARLNMNLREDKHWSYGVSSFIFDARGPRPYAVFAPVQADKTMESMAEIKKEIDQFLSSRPPSSEELGNVQDGATLTLSGIWETNGSVANYIGQRVRFGFPRGYFDRFANDVRSVSLAEVKAAARQHLHPNKLIWIVVGDREQIQAKIQELNLGEIVLINADGNRVNPKRAALQP